MSVVSHEGSSLSNRLWTLNILAILPLRCVMQIAAFVTLVGLLGPLQIAQNDVNQADF